MAEDDDVYVVGHGGRAHALKAEVFAKREFAGYWEYLLDEALFTTPPHPEWSGAALLDDEGQLIGIGSLLLQEEVGDEVVNGNMFVPDRPASSRYWTTSCGPDGRPSRRGRGSACTPPIATTASWSTGSRAAARPSAPACTRAISSSRSARERVASLADLFREIWRLGPRAPRSR